MLHCPKTNVIGKYFLKADSFPLLAFEHLSLYIQKHLGQSVALCDILWKGRSWQTKVQPGTAGQSQVKPGTARYSAEKTHHVLYFWKAGALRISNMILRGMSGASTGACLGHLLGSVWGIIWGMSGATSGSCVGHYLGHVWDSLRYPWCYIHLWCRFFCCLKFTQQSNKQCNQSFKKINWYNFVDKSLRL